jgi:hypothetical protein
MAIHVNIIANVSIFGTIYRYIGLDNQQFPIVLIIDGIDTSIIAIVSMSMSQSITSKAPSTGDDDTTNDVSMADP